MSISQWSITITSAALCMYHLNSLEHPQGVTFTLVAPILWLEKLRFRKIKSLDQGHTTSNLQSWGSDRLTTPLYGAHFQPLFHYSGSPTTRNSLTHHHLHLHLRTFFPFFQTQILPHPLEPSQATLWMALLLPLNFHCYFLYILCKSNMYIKHVMNTYYVPGPALSILHHYLYTKSYLKLLSFPLFHSRGKQGTVKLSTLGSLSHSLLIPG